MNCTKAGASPITATASLQLDQFAAPGAYSCTGYFTSGSWTPIVYASSLIVPNTNPTCKCVPPGLSFSRLDEALQHGLQFWVNEDTGTPALRSRLMGDSGWFAVGAAMWNNQLVIQASDQRITLVPRETPGAHEIRFEPIPEAGVAAMYDDTNTLVIDPNRVVDNDLQATRVGHEIGHALGAKHPQANDPSVPAFPSGCSESDTIMWPSLSVARTGLRNGDVCFADRNFNPVNLKASCQP